MSRKISLLLVIAIVLTSLLPIGMPVVHTILKMILYKAGEQQETLRLE